MNSNICNDCPYINQEHLSANFKISRHPPQVVFEDNSSNILIVLQAPGIEEWNVGAAIQPTTKQGGTAGARIIQSWQRTNMNRTQFDILNVVQCFPGVALDGRDLIPKANAIEVCKRNVENVIMNKNYEKIIAFGNIAQNCINEIIASLIMKPIVESLNHPCGGLSKTKLDACWAI